MQLNKSSVDIKSIMKGSNNIIITMHFILNQNTHISNNNHILYKSVEKHVKLFVCPVHSCCHLICATSVASVLSLRFLDIIRRLEDITVVLSQKLPSSIIRHLPLAATEAKAGGRVVTDDECVPLPFLIPCA